MSRQLAYDSYKDSNGDPQFAHSCVLFWDVLGVRSMAKGAQVLPDVIALRRALERARARAGTEEPDFTRASTWFTDNVVIGTPVVGLQDVEQVLGHTQVDVAYMMLLLLDAGFLARGGITFGDHYMDETFVFGPALIDAVDLEKATKWPRVALSQLAADLNREVVRRFYGDPAFSPQAGELLCDTHGDVFVDHLNVWFGEEDEPSVIDHYLPRYKATIEQALATHSTGGPVWEKWKWLADYHNYSMSTNLQSPQSFLISAGPPQHGFVSFIQTL